MSKYVMAGGQRMQSRLANEDLSGVGQLSLVEHALCPLDCRASLRQNLRHESEYRFMDAKGCSRLAKVVVHCPAGLSASDEFYLWGLLALTFAQPTPQIDFQATPHFCLRNLGLISPDSKGGKSYRLFRESLRRLSAVRYQNDGFYDPIRREHRSVSFGLFSYSLPLNIDSSRAWRIVWDPIFFEYCQATASQLRFDLGKYRGLDHASRRLFLLLSKVFWRSHTSPCFDVRHLAVHVLGFSDALATRTLKAKVKRCVKVLQEQDLLAPTAGDASQVFHRQGKTHHKAQFVRGRYFDRRRPVRKKIAVQDSPLLDPLRAIGFDNAGIRRILAGYSTERIQLWADVTLAAIEHKGKAFFRRSPQAFFMDNIRHAVADQRTPPDWFWAIRKHEQQRRADRARKARSRQPLTSSRPLAETLQSTCGILDLKQNCDGIVARLTEHFMAAGQDEAAAKRNAQRFAKESAHPRQSRIGK